MSRTTNPPSASPKFLARLNVKVADFGVRNFEALFGVSKSTVSRANRGMNISLGNAQSLGRVVKVCPCCDRRWQP